MRFIPGDLHRERTGTERPATWYVIWQGVPHGEGSVIIGRAKRLRRHREFRFFPEAGGECRDILGFIDGMEWLAKEHAQAGAAPD
jgi:hypothetical protein